MTNFTVTTVDYSHVTPRTITLESKTGSSDTIDKHYWERSKFYREAGYKSSGCTLHTNTGIVTNLDKGNSIIKLTITRA